MRRVTCEVGTTTAPNGLRLQHGISYVCTDGVAMEWFNAAPDGVRISSIRSWERPYFGHDLNGKRLWVSRGAGFGDQLVMSGVLRELKRRWSEATIDFATAPGADVLFGMNDADSEARHLFRFSPYILPFDEWRAYDFHRIVEEIIELDREPDQTGIWQTHFRFFGIDPATVAPEHMRPVNIVTSSAQEMADAFIHDECGDSEFILVQLASTSPIRSLSPKRIENLLAALVLEFPKHKIVAVGSRLESKISTPEGIEKLKITLPQQVIPCVGKDPRIMVGLVGAASAIVAPDSCINHIAAGLGEASPPVVSLWSSFDPDRRVRTYPNQHPIYSRPPCAPCFMHEHSEPPMGCPLYRGHCRGLDAIPDATIIEKLKEVLP